MPTQRSGEMPRYQHNLFKNFQVSFPWHLHQNSPIFFWTWRFRAGWPWKSGWKASLRTLKCNELELGRREKFKFRVPEKKVPGKKVEFGKNRSLLATDRSISALFSYESRREASCLEKSIYWSLGLIDPCQITANESHLKRICDLSLW